MSEPTLCRCGEPATVNGRCAAHERRREYARQWAARRRQQALDAARMRGNRCPRKLGRLGVCNALLETFTDGAGHVGARCPACERMARGLCADCNAPVAGTVGKARRCLACRKAFAARCTRRYTDEHRRACNAKARRYGRKHRQTRAEYKRLWRKANPDKVRAQKRRAALRQSERSRAYHAAYAERRREAMVASARARYRGELPPRLCLMPGCDRVVCGRRKACRPCLAMQQQTARAQLAERKAA